jgi:formylglycine-generating enzyme required for sulfatase activity
LKGSYVLSSRFSSSFGGLVGVRSSFRRSNRSKRAQFAFGGAALAIGLIVCLPDVSELLTAAAVRQVGVDARDKKLPTNSSGSNKSSKKPVRKRRNTNSQASGNGSVVLAGVLRELTASFVQVPAGEFLMGSESGYPDEKPIHDVTISRAFEMSKYEVTQAQWLTVMGNNPSDFKGADLPVENVSWDEVQIFLEKLNARKGGYTYRLPTEAEWEYACRGGSNGDYAGNLDNLAWYAGDSGFKVHSTGRKQPNAWGLYDMHGNVSEWCQDRYDYAYYSDSSRVDPQGPESGWLRTARGGNWVLSEFYCRSAARSGFPPTQRGQALGFRLARNRRG